MTKNKILVFLFICSYTISLAQTDFISKGVISYEIKVNNHKNSWWSEEEDADNTWYKNFIENTPKFSVYYYDLLFTNKKSLYQYTGRDEKIKKVWDDDYREDNVWYNDFEKGTYSYQKNVFGNTMRLEDSIQKMKWQIVPNDTREFIGYNCKKAVGIIFDSVYVFAYYTDEIIPSVGPMSLNGLPGAILAITIPRMHMSVVATKFSPFVTEEKIVPKKKSKVKSRTQVFETIKENTKDWGKWAHKGIWQSFL